MNDSVTATVIKSDQGMALSGALVFASVSDLIEQGNQHLKQHHNQPENDSVFVIDCESMNRIDSAGIALLIEWQRQGKNNNLTCRFEGLSKQAQALIEAYSLESLIAV